MVKNDNSAFLNLRYKRALVSAAAIVAAAASARIASAALIVEAEPNNSFGTAAPLAAGSTFVSNISPVGDIDWYSSPGRVSGELVFAFMDSQGSSASQDATLYAIDNSLAIIEFDDGSGPGDSSALAGVEIPVDGNLYLASIETTSAAQITPYVLYHAIVNPADAAAETEPNDSVGQAQPVAGSLVTGEVSGIDVDFFAFEASAGQAIVVICDDNPDGDATNTDTGLQIISVDGTTILATGDNTLAADANAAGTATATETGTHYLRVINGSAASDTEYRLVILVDGEVVEPAPPAPEPCADLDGDGVCDDVDLCSGDDASGDSDGDGYCDDTDICPSAANADQADADGDGVGDVCEEAEETPDPGLCGSGFPFFSPMLLVGAGLARRRTRRNRMTSRTVTPV